MPTLHRLSSHNVRICMFPDHAPPHFHVIGRGWSAKIDLRDLSIIVGGGPAAPIKEALDWASQNRQYLRTKWNQLNERDG